MTEDRQADLWAAFIVSIGLLIAGAIWRLG